MTTLTATPTSTNPNRPVALAYSGSEGGSLRITRPGGSRYYLSTVVGSGIRTYTPTTTGTYRADLFTKNKPLRTLVSTAFGVTPAVPVTPPPPLNATRMATEGGAFIMPRTGIVWYGAATGWTTRQYPKGTLVLCEYGYFGDPAPNLVKGCYVVPLILVGTPGPQYVDLAWTP